MPLEPSNQIEILTDILKNHQTDCCGTVSECQQLERLIKSLLSQQELDANVKNTLLDIYQYSQTGQYTQNLDGHIDQHKNEFDSWINDLQLT